MSGKTLILLAGLVIPSSSRAQTRAQVGEAPVQIGAAGSGASLLQPGNPAVIPFVPAAVAPLALPLSPALSAVAPVALAAPSAPLPPAPAAAARTEAPRRTPGAQARRLETSKASLKSQTPERPETAAARDAQNGLFDGQTVRSPFFADVDAVVGETPAETSSSRYDNRYYGRVPLVSGARAALKLGFMPDAQAKVDLHSDKLSAGRTSWTLHLGKERKAIMKGRRAVYVNNELFMRQLIPAFFNRHFRAPKAVGYGGRLVTEYLDKASDSVFAYKQLSMTERSVLFVLKGAFQLTDFFKAPIMFETKDSRPYLVDLESSLFEPPPKIPEEKMEPWQRHFKGIGEAASGMILPEMPWVSADFRNDPADFLPAVREWQAFSAKPEVRAHMFLMLRRAGFSRRRATDTLGIILRNTARMDEFLAEDLGMANRYFQKEAGSAGLNERQTEALSRINRGLLNPSAGEDAGRKKDWLRKVLIDYWIKRHNPERSMTWFTGFQRTMQTLDARSLALYLTKRPHGPTPEDVREAAAEAGEELRPWVEKSSADLAEWLK